MKTAVRGIFYFALSGLVLAALAACGGGGYGGDGGGGGGGGGGGATYTVGGTVTGLNSSGSGLILRNNGGGDLAVGVSGTFTFATKVANGTAYAVTVWEPPINPFQTCVVTNGSGTMGSSNVTNVSVACTTNSGTGACGIAQATGLTSAGSAEGAWGGRFYIFKGLDGLYGNGVVTADGQARFWVGSGDMYIGSVLASSSGAVSSVLTLYSRLAGGSPGGPKSSAPPADQSLGFETASAGASLRGKYIGAFSNCQPVSLTYSDVYLRPASLAAAAGVYTVSGEDFYTLTVTIHSDGQLDGSDTLGCMLIGSFAIPDPAVNYYSAVADATTCGTLDGHYVGMLSLSDHAPNDLAQLNLSLSNSDAAIFGQLTR